MKFKIKKTKITTAIRYVNYIEPVRFQTDVSHLGDKKTVQQALLRGQPRAQKAKVHKRVHRSQNRRLRRPLR